MNKQKPVKVAITGAAGQIGYALLFRIASGQMFGPNTPVHLHLLELPAAAQALEGVAMELDDCAFPLLEKVVCTTELSEAMNGVNWSLLVGSVPRKQGMERSDLLEINGKIFTSQGRAINDYAADDVRVFVVGNPCNTNCLIAAHNAPDVPKDRFYAMTTLDENRAIAQLAKKAGVSVTDVKNVTIWGNHSSTQFPDAFNATIQGEPVINRIKDEVWLKETFISTIQQRGAAVIKARGASSAASAANGVVDGVSHLVNETELGNSYSMCRVSQGEYGVPPGLVFSMRCRTEQGQLKVVEGLSFNEFARDKFDITLNELRQEEEIVKSLGLIE